MRIKAYFKDGQTHCYDCGSEFILDGDTAISCPSDECSRGSWLSWEPHPDFPIVGMIDVTRQRRRIEDRLRKDKGFFELVRDLIGPVKLRVEKSPSALCNDCGELGYFAAVYPDGRHTHIANRFFCPACGAGINNN